MTMTLLTMTLMNTAGCGGASPLRPSAEARDHVETPAVLSLAEGPAISGEAPDCTPTVSPASGSRTAHADETARWTMSIAFLQAPPDRRHQCRWTLESADGDLVVHDAESGTRSTATSARAGDGTVEIVVPAAGGPAGGTAVPTLRLLRLTASGADRPTYWSYSGYRWKRQ